MKIMNLEQGSEEWLSWRKTVITATDIAVILGISPYATPYQLWQRKQGLIEEQFVNGAMKRGSHLEPLARDKFIEEYGITMEPVVAEHSDHAFIGASLDGISPCGRYILEIKCNGDARHAEVKKGIIPDFHTAQMQHQMLVTGANKCFYYSFDGIDGICIEVPADESFMEDALNAAREFYRALAVQDAPALTDRDYRCLDTDKDWSELSEIYMNLEAELKACEKKKDDVRKKIIQFCEDKPCRGAGLKVMKATVRGRVDYSAIPELSTVDLDKYRKETTGCWKIMLDKTKE